MRQHLGSGQVAGCCTHHSVPHIQQAGCSTIPSNNAFICQCANQPLADCWVHQLVLKVQGGRAPPCLCCPLAAPPHPNALQRQQPSPQLDSHTPIAAENVKPAPAWGGLVLGVSGVGWGWVGRDATGWGGGRWGGGGWGRARWGEAGWGGVNWDGLGWAGMAQNCSVGPH